MPGAEATQAYSRDQVCRLLGVSERQLRSWEQRGLVPSAESFGFRDLVALRTLVGLRRKGVTTERIRKVLAKLRKTLRDVENPLTDLRLIVDGKKIHVQLAGQRMEPDSGQLLLDFSEPEWQKMVDFPGAAPPSPSRELRSRVSAEQWFQQGLELELTGAPPDTILDAYQKAIQLDPASVGALVNLGTVYFNMQQWTKAESYYTLALEADPQYALAHFNLGNLYDETGQRRKALQHYQAAIQINPRYADPHYNLALLYQTTGEIMNAIRHWRIYVKLDPSGEWSDIARRELDKLTQSIVRGAGAE